MQSTPLNILTIIFIYLDSLYLAADWNRSACEKFFTDHWDSKVIDYDNQCQGASKKSAIINLDKCMEMFTSKEQLGKDNTWYFIYLLLFSLEFLNDLKLKTRLSLEKFWFVIDRNRTLRTHSY